MKSLFYLHWNEEECKERLQALQNLGLAIHSHWQAHQAATLGNPLPDLFVISLERLPSHGTQYVDWLWSAKNRQHIPVIFVDGQPGKLEKIKARFPKAIYCSNKELVATIKNVMNH